MNHRALTHLIVEVNHLIDTGRYDSITVAEIRDQISSGRVLQFLKARAGAEIDLSIYETPTYGNFKAFYSSYLQDIATAYAGDEMRKWGVENRGLCLLIAWTTEILAHGSGWTPKLNMADVEY